MDSAAHWELARTATSKAKNRTLGAQPSTGPSQPFSVVRKHWSEDHAMSKLTEAMKNPDWRRRKDASSSSTFETSSGSDRSSSLLHQCQEERLCPWSNQASDRVEEFYDCIQEHPLLSDSTTPTRPASAKVENKGSSNGHCDLSSSEQKQRDTVLSCLLLRNAKMDGRLPIHILDIAPCDQIPGRVSASKS